jgi:hypothetical protein
MRALLWSSPARQVPGGLVFAPPTGLEPDLWRIFPDWMLPSKTGTFPLLHKVYAIWHGIQ